MEFNYAYKGNSTVLDRGGDTRMSFAPDLKREPVYFLGDLRQNIAFREAMM
jgi:hypothetical protein